MMRSRGRGGSADSASAIAAHYKNMVFSLLASLGRGAVDMFLAGIVLAVLVATLPLLTLASRIILRRWFRSKAEQPAAAAAASSGQSNSNGDTLAGDLALFAVKATVIFLLLLQASMLLGGPAASWAGAFVIERMVRGGDSSLQLLADPPLGPVDYVFLCFIAPCLAAPTAAVHGLAAGWLTFACAAFFWRSDASSGTAFSLWVLAYLLAYVLGLFGWQRLVEAAGLEPADDSIADAALLVAGVGVLLLVPSGTRGTLMAAILAFSPSFRSKVASTLRMSTFAMGGARDAVAVAIGLTRQANSVPDP